MPSEFDASIVIDIIISRLFTLHLGGLSAAALVREWVAYSGASGRQLRFRRRLVTLYQAAGLTASGGVR